MRRSCERLNHYRTLGVKYDATKREIRSAFLEMAKAHHPDANGSSADAVRKFQAAAEAHAVLSSSDDKAAYDLRIGNVKMPHAAAAQKGKVTAPRRPGGDVGFNFEEWNYWHYGDEYGRRQSIEAKTRLAFTQGRTKQERQEAFVLSSQRKEREHIVDRLNNKRKRRVVHVAHERPRYYETRAASSSPSGAAAAPEGACTIS